MANDEKSEIYVIIKRPGEAAFETRIANDLETLQRWVGGYIETYTLCTCPTVVLICNEEGRILGMTPNCRIQDVTFVGTILLVGAKGEEFASSPYRLKTAAAIWPELRRPLPTRRNGKRIGRG